MPECVAIRFTATFECSRVRGRPRATDRSSATGDRRSFELGLHPWTQNWLGFFVKYDQVQPSILKRSSSVCMRCGHSARGLLCRRRLVVRSTAKGIPPINPQAQGQNFAGAQSSVYPSRSQAEASGKMARRRSNRSYSRSSSSSGWLLLVLLLGLLVSGGCWLDMSPDEVEVWEDGWERARGHILRSVARLAGRRPDKAKAAATGLSPPSHSSMLSNSLKQPQVSSLLIGMARKGLYRAGE